MIPNSAGRTYVPSFFPQPEPYSAPREVTPNSTAIPSLFPTAQAGTRDPSSWDYVHGGLRGLGLVFPPAKAATTIWDVGSGFAGGFNRAAYDERPESKSPSLLGKDLGAVGRLADRALFSRDGIGSFIGDKVGWAAGSIYDLLAGSKEKTVPPSFAGPQQSYQQASYFAPKQQQPAAPLESTRKIEARPVQPDMTAAMKSLYDAYTKGSRYDESGKGWVADPSKDYRPEPVAPQPTYFNDNGMATLAQLGGSVGDVTNWLNQGGYSLMPAQGPLTFGMSRFATLDHGGAFNPSTMPAAPQDSYYYAEDDSRDGIQRRFGSGRFNTD